MARVFLRSLVLALVAVCAAGATVRAGRSQAEGRRIVTDLCGRRVSLPAHITRAVTAEGTPSVNSFLMGLGKAGLIVNGLPPSMRGPHWNYQRYFAPQLAGQPAVSVTGTAWVPNLEVLQGLPHDVVFVVTPTMADLLESRGFTAFCLGWHRPGAMALAVTRLGEILECPDRARAWVDYFQQVQDRVAARLTDLPPEKRCSVLYLRSEGPTSSRTIRDLVIRAGGRYVAPPALPLPNLMVGAERLMEWDPDVLLVMGPREARAVMTDPRYAVLRAVREKRVYAVPSGALAFTHPTPERALGVLWMAKRFYPDRFADVDMDAEARDFYRRFFDRPLSEAQVRDILREAPASP